MKASTAGQLRNRIHFQRRGGRDDGFGNELPAGPFSTQFTVWAKLLPLRGSETVMAGRLAGVQAYIVTVRQSSQTRQVTEAWQIVDARNPKRVFAITAPPTDPDGTRAWLDIFATEGPAS